MEKFDLFAEIIGHFKKEFFDFNDKPSHSTVSTAGIGEGPLTITIVNLSTNQVLPAQIIADASTAHLFHVQWMPVEACFVKININFAGVEALGRFLSVKLQSNDHKDTRKIILK